MWSNKITVSDMTIQNICKYYNVGYCKDKCKFKHAEEDCDRNKCRRKICLKWHRKFCRKLRFWQLIMKCLIWGQKRRSPSRTQFTLILRKTKQLQKTNIWFPKLYLTVCYVIICSKTVKSCYNTGGGFISVKIMKNVLKKMMNMKITNIKSMNN